MRSLKISLILICLLAFFLGSFFLFRKKNQKEFESAITYPAPNQEIQAEKLVKLETKDDFNKLESKYCINYGKENAPIKIVEFFTFQCPHCIRLFRTEFENLKKDFIDTGKVSFTFHPVPQDLPTAQALLCLEQLDAKQKQLFLEVILEEVDPSDPELTARLMMTAMNIFKKPIPNLEDPEFLSQHPVFEKIFLFIKQRKILAVPSVEVNGHLFANEIPDYLFIKSVTKD